MKIKKLIALSLSLVVAASSVFVADVDAASKPKLSKKSVSVNVGKTVKISVKNAKKSAKVTFSISKSSIAKITKKTKKGNAYAKVKGIKKGKAKLTAKVKMGKKMTKLNCTVNVKAKENKNPSSAKPTQAPAKTGDSTPKPTQPAAAPTPTPIPGEFKPLTQDYSYYDELTFGYEGAVVAYGKDGKKISIKKSGAKVYNYKNDNAFEQQFDNTWDADGITLTPPLRYTTTDGKVNDVYGTVTDYNFWADPTCINNEDVDGKLYVYGTREGVTYKEEDGLIDTNDYDNSGLTIASTEDMVNWTDEGLICANNLTNEVSTSDKKVKLGWGPHSWAPSGLKIDGDGDGKDEYYVFYTNGNEVGYVQGDSPTGPWKDDYGTTLFTRDLPNCEGVLWCFDPAVLADDKGNAYVYFGGGVPDGCGPIPKTGRVCKIKFEKGTGKVLLDGDPKVLDTFYFFEDSEINQINGKYIFSYCTNFNTGSETLVGRGQIAAYVSSDPMNIAFDPKGENGTKFTDADGTYHNFLGTILDNPSTMYGESYNNHHHMQNFKGHNYIFYHSTFIPNTLLRIGKKYRNLHVDEIDIDTDNDKITIEPTYTGPKQLANFNPYTNKDGKQRFINATTAGRSAGVNAKRDDYQVLNSINGSPMVLDNIDTGDWTCIRGVDFGSKGLKSVGFEYLSNLKNNPGKVEYFIDDPTKLANKVGEVEIRKNTNGKYEVVQNQVTKSVTGVHDIYMVFRGDSYNIATWLFSENDKIEVPAGR